MKKQESIPLDALSDIELIEQCGKLGYSVDQTLQIFVRSKSSTQMAVLRFHLQTEGTDEHNAYSAGIAVGQLEIDMELRSDALTGERDGYKSFSAEQHRKTVNDAIRRNFGL